MVWSIALGHISMAFPAMLAVGDGIFSKWSRGVPKTSHSLLCAWSCWLLTTCMGGINMLYALHPATPRSSGAVVLLADARIGLSDMIYRAGLFRRTEQLGWRSRSVLHLELVYAYCTRVVSTICRYHTTNLYLRQATTSKWAGASVNVVLHLSLASQFT